MNVKQFKNNFFQATQKNLDVLNQNDPYSNSQPPATNPMLFCSVTTPEDFAGIFHKSQLIKYITYSI